MRQAGHVSNGREQTEGWAEHNCWACSACLRQGGANPPEASRKARVRRRPAPFWLKSAGQADAERTATDARRTCRDRARPAPCRSRTRARSRRRAACGGALSRRC